MKVLKPTTDEQTFYFIPRSYDIDDTINFRDDQTNEVVIYTPTMVKENDFIKIREQLSKPSIKLAAFLVMNYIINILEKIDILKKYKQKSYLIK